MWDSVAFVSYRELSRKAQKCKKLLPILHSCIFIWCLRIKTCLKLFLKRWDEENFDCRFIEKMKSEGKQRLFLWSIISSSWDSDCSSELLDKIVKLWVTLRGFSLCGAWMEAYRVANKKATQKAKAILLKDYSSF